MVSKQKVLCFFVSLYAFVGVKGQQTIEASGITFKYKVKSDSLHIVLKAPTEGWVGLGFNSKNNIVGSDLLLFNVRGKQVKGIDLFVKGPGNPVKDSENGGENTVAIKKGTEEKGSTEIYLSIPMDSGDPNDFVHIIGQKAWLILAYSVSDDFAHHSRVRKHVAFVLQK